MFNNIQILNQTLTNQSVLDGPFLPAERTVLVRALFSPLEYAMQVKVMQTLPLDGYAVISWYLASGARQFELELADGAALLVLDVPFPCSHGVP